MLAMRETKKHKERKKNYLIDRNGFGVFECCR